MAFIYYKRVHKNGKTYVYPELRESRRVPGKKNPVSVTLGRIGGSTRKAADERYREVLRENVYTFGNSRPGERYRYEAWAREQYHKHIDAEQTPEVPHPEQEPRDAMNRARDATFDFYTAQERYRVRHAADIRERDYKSTHASPKTRAEQEQASRKQAAEDELAREADKAADGESGQ
jgi:hypothetical protein